MRLNKTFFLATFTLLIVSVIYIFDYRVVRNREKEKQILAYDPSQITHIEIIKPEIKIELQKNETGWWLKQSSPGSGLKPLQDHADSNNIEDLLADLAKEKQILVVKKSEETLAGSDLQEFGLDKPAIIFSFKSNLGSIKKISVGALKNYEGNSYIQIDSENRIIMAGSRWFSESERELIHYREKKLYRHALAKIKKIKIRSLQDSFDLKQADGKWISPKNASDIDRYKIFDIDQNKVREFLKKMAETSILQYIFEGKPSAALIKEKGLDRKSVYVELLTEDTSWTASFNLYAKDRALYVLTSEPAFLVKVDITAWEYFGNLKLDKFKIEEKNENDKQKY